MNISEEVSFSKEGNIEKFPWLRKFFLSLVIILIALISFGLGRLSVGEREGIRLEYDQSLIPTQPAQALGGAKSATPNVVKEWEVVASSKGTKYHYPHCSGAKRITEANKIVFTSAQAAEASGYTLAANCRPK